VVDADTIISKFHDTTCEHFLRVIVHIINKMEKVQQRIRAAVVNNAELMTEMVHTIDDGRSFDLKITVSVRSETISTGTTYTSATLVLVVSTQPWRLNHGRWFASLLARRARLRTKKKPSCEKQARSDSMTVATRSHEHLHQ